MGILARLGVVLGLDSAEFAKGLEQANKKLDQFSTVARTSAVAAGAAFAAMTAKAVQYADAVVDTAKANDMAVESVLALSRALKLNGGEAENAGKLIASFTNQLESAASGSKTAQDMFKKIGVSLTDLANLEVTELFDKTVNALAKIEDPITRNALAMQAFGRAAKGVDFVGLAQGTKEARAEFAQYAEAVKRAADLNDLLAEKAGNFMVRFTNEVIPTLMDLYESLSKNSDAFEAFWWIVREGTKVAAIIIKYMATIVQGLIEDITFAGRSIKNLFRADLDAIVADYAEYQKRIQALKQSDIDFEKRLFGPKEEKTPDGKPKPKGALRSVTPAKDAEADKLRIALELAKQLSEEYRRQSEFELSQIIRQTQLMQLTDKQREVEEAVLRVRDSNSKQLEDIDRKITAAIIARETELAQELMFQKQQIEQMGRVYEDQTRKAIERQQEIRNSFEFGWNKAFNQYAEDAENFAKKGEEAFNVFATNINSAINNFVETGKFKFNDFVRSIILGLIKIEMQMQAMQLFKMGKSWLGGMFSFGSQSPASIFDLFPTAADGGQINGPTLVGEHGPELFIPQNQGTVIPNQRLSGALSGDTYVTNNYIDAIDTKSFEERLLGSPNAIWAANKYADKSLQVGRGRT